MSSSRQKWAFSLIVAAVAVPLAVVSVAFACGRLATLFVGPQRVAPGAEVSGFGRNYTAAPTASAVDIRFNRRSGPVLWSGRPAPNGEIRPAFAVPSGVKAGYYTLLAMQTTPTGAPSPGTPGRARIFIGTASQKRAVDSSAAVWASAPVGGGTGGGSGQTVPADVGVLAALLSAGLLAGGVALLRDDRRRRSPGTLAS